MGRSGDEAWSGRPGPPAGLRAAQDVARQTAARLLASVRVGLRELELQAEALRIARELGSSGAWTPPRTRVGIGTTVAHPDFPMQDRRAVTGDPVVLDIGPTVDGWLGDHCIGAVLDDDDGEVVDGCRWVRQRLIAAADPGMPSRELHALGVRLAAERDLRLLDLLGTVGHSIGRSSPPAASSTWNPMTMVGARTVEPHLGRRGPGANSEVIV